MSRFAALALCIVASSSSIVTVCARAQDTADQPMAIGLVEETAVSSRVVPAVNFRRPGSAGTHLDFVGTDLAPGGKGQIDVDSKKGYVQVQASTWGLPPAAEFGSEYMTYVMWAVTPEGRATNLGELLVEKGSKEDRSRLEVTSDLQTFGLVVTAEPHFAVTMPSDLVVLENALKRGTEGEVELIDAKYQLLKRGHYAFRGASRTDLDAPSAPFYIVQARNSRRIADQLGAREHAAEPFAKASALLAEAEATDNRSQGLSLAKQAAQTFEDARLIAEERVRVQREERAAADAERARREASMAQAGQASAELDADRARMDAAAAERARLEAQLALEQADAARQRAEADRARVEAEQAALRKRLLDQMSLVFEARETARGLILNMPNVLFDFNRSTLRPEAREKLARLSGIVQSNPGLQLQVEGHADAIGTDEYNQQLSEKRAGAVREYLVGQGVGADTITSRGFGESQPIASNDTDEGRQQNRRVEIVVSGDLIGIASAQ